MKAEDLREIGDLGAGNGGSVKKVTHLPTGTTMAKKVRLCKLIICPGIDKIFPLRLCSSMQSHPFENKFYENCIFCTDATTPTLSHFMVHL
jgi:hypothetical protein